MYRFVNYRFGNWSSAFWERSLQDVVTCIPDTSNLIFTHQLLLAMKSLLNTKHLRQDCYEYVIGDST